MFADIGQGFLDGAQQLEGDQRGQGRSHVLTFEVNCEIVAVFIRIDVLANSGRQTAFRDSRAKLGDRFSHVLVKIVGD